jgi:hypothetical protein
VGLGRALCRAGAAAAQHVRGAGAVPAAAALPVGGVRRRGGARGVIPEMADAGAHVSVSSLLCSHARVETEHWIR